MAYGPLQQRDSEVDSATSASPSLHPLASPVFAPPLSASLGLFLDDFNTSQDERDEITSPSSSGLVQMVQSITSKSTKTSGSYDLLENDDFADDAPASPRSPAVFVEKHKGSSPSETTVPQLPLYIPRPSRRRSPATAADKRFSPTIPSEPIVRTASGRRAALRHPTPDLQVLTGAYTGNIEHLERTAERLSMTSSIDNAIKELHDEQKRSESRRPSLINGAEMAGISRKVSNASSIVEVNSAARAGGYSPAGFMMSPKGSFTNASTRLRSASKSSRFGSRPEPELEGRPLDSFVNMTSTMGTTSPVMSPSASIAEQDESSSTLTKPVVDQIDAEGGQQQFSGDDRPTTSASTNTYDNGQMFEGFDGVHTEPVQKPQERVTFAEEVNIPDDSDIGHRRVLSSGNRLSMPRPQSYADPNTGQQMVYYPAPVPMMLNLPQKLSKAPSSMAKNKRRSQVLSAIPAANRQSAIWLPDVLEDEPGLAEDEYVQEQEYVPQHQRTTMGGRRNTQDLQHLPPQLRASAFFDLPAPAQTVELKEQSAVATLDSILDASAHAPVSAFTDHLIAGHLGAEVYGRPNLRHNRSNTQLLDPQGHKKRTSSFNLLRGRRNSSSDLPDTDKERRRASTMSGIEDGGQVRMPLDDDMDDATQDTTPLNRSDAGGLHSRLPSGDFDVTVEDEEGSDDGQRDDEVYHGPPTTLLAELQLRKQQQKQRTRPTATAYPNGMHSTLLQLDAVAQVEQKSRKQKRVNLAWESPAVQEPDDGAGSDEDIPLAVLYAQKAADVNRPLGLLERREMEDNEPLSKRRERLGGRPALAPRAATMMNLAPPDPEEEEGETLAQRIRRLKEKGGTATGLPSARPVSGDFASEMMSQFGGDLLDKAKVDVNGKGKEVSEPAPEEEETLGQRRKRLQAEREARAREVGPVDEMRPQYNQKHSMADILQAHPVANGTAPLAQQKPVGGLLGMHEKQKERRSSTMLNLDYHTPPQPQRNLSGGFKSGLYNDGQGGIVPQQLPQQNYGNMYGYNAPFPQPSLGFNGFNQPIMPFPNTYAMNYTANAMQMGYMPNLQPNPMLQMGAGVQPLNQGQIDMVERWRQSVMQ
ncbi:hypothetical protein G7Y89_g3640 [Cudoniella acicularis]|uniref:Uncharacterized protein n=1 Tax=Cudoniella acicularis TaxID=354080 RepID=A0A8H4W507_9HELO|nr:hypothetical protein G7Y89_g3640 [Cudoniella acicularis]